MPYPLSQNLGIDDDISDLKEIEKGEIAINTQKIKNIEELSGFN